MSLPDLLGPLRAGVELLLATFHSLLGGGPSGLAWLAAVALLVVAVRGALLPLAVRQFRSAARMRTIAPEAAALRGRYRGRTDPKARESLARETAELYRRHGVHPLASFLPALVQLPILLALVQALEHATHASGTAALAGFAAAVALGAPLAATALTGGVPGAVVGGALLVVTAAAQMLTQHLASGDAAVGGRLLLLLPLATAASGLLFPIGVTAYWACSALWTLGQQVVLPRLIRA